jgi:hypothetical protein
MDEVLQFAKEKELWRNVARERASRREERRAGAGAGRKGKMRKRQSRKERKEGYKSSG